MMCGGQSRRHTPKNRRRAVLRLQSRNGSSMTLGGGVPSQFIFSPRVPASPPIGPLDCRQSMLAAVRGPPVSGRALRHDKSRERRWSCGACCEHAGIQRSTTQHSFQGSMRCHS